MALNILVAFPDEDKGLQLQKLLIEEHFTADVSFTGKDAQLQCYKQKYFAIFLDFEITNHSALEVLKYVKVTLPSTKVIIVLENDEVLKKLELTKEDVLKLGACDVIIRPITKDLIQKAINGEMQFKLWKIGQFERKSGDTEEIRARDDEFTRIKIDDFTTGNNAIFDIYIRVNENRYLKILHANDYFDPEQVNKYKLKHKVEFLYFRTRDRGLYIHYVNQTIEELIKKKPDNNKIKTPAEKLAILNEQYKLTKNLVEKYVEEIYNQGLQPQIVEEGNLVCQNMTLIIQKDKDLSHLMRQFEEFDPSTFTHCFLTTFFSSILCKQLEWVSGITFEKMALGAMFHDIGKLRLNPKMANLNISQMNAQELAEYKLHPKLGVEMLSPHKTMTQPVLQIVYQHHERIDGSGFPMGITGIKIFPLAQIVGFADMFSHIMVDEKIPPIEALKRILKNKKLLPKINPALLKALAQSFVEDKIEFK